MHVVFHVSAPCPPSKAEEFKFFIFSLNYVPFFGLSLKTRTISGMEIVERRVEWKMMIEIKSFIE